MAILDCIHPQCIYFNNLPTVCKTLLSVILHECFFHRAQNYESTFVFIDNQCWPENNENTQTRKAGWWLKYWHHWYEIWKDNLIFPHWPFKYAAGDKHVLYLLHSIRCWWITMLLNCENHSIYSAKMNESCCFVLQ